MLRLKGMCRLYAVAAWNQQLGAAVVRRVNGRYGMLKRELVVDFILSLFAVIRVFLHNRSDTALEILALRQQVAVLKRKHPRSMLNTAGPNAMNGSGSALSPKTRLA